MDEFLSFITKSYCYVYFPLILIRQLENLILVDLQWSIIEKCKRKDSLDKFCDLFYTKDHLSVDVACMYMNSHISNLMIRTIHTFQNSQFIQPMHSKTHVSYNLHIPKLTIHTTHASQNSRFIQSMHSKSHDSYNPHIPSLMIRTLHTFQTS